LILGLASRCHCATGSAIASTTEEIVTDIKHGEKSYAKGQVLGPSDWVEVTQAMIDEYAHAVHDQFWIHVDVDRAKEKFGGTIAHGLLVLSIAPPLAARLIKLPSTGVDLNYGYDKVRFLSVVHGGDRIRVWVEVIDTTPRGEGQLVRMKVTIEVEGREKPAIIAEWLLITFAQSEELARQAKVGAAAE
jgi:acyl dehydratase